MHVFEVNNIIDVPVVLSSDIVITYSLYKRTAPRNPVAQVLKKHEKIKKIVAQRLPTGIELFSSSPAIGQPGWKLEGVVLNQMASCAM